MCSYDVGKPIRLKLEKKAGLIWRYVTNQFEAMPFGFMNFLTPCHRMKGIILANVSNVRRHFDDIAIFSESTEEHSMHLATVFRFVKVNKLRLGI